MTMLENVQLPSELVSILDAMPGPRILIDIDYRILAANYAYRTEYGEPALVVGVPVIAPLDALSDSPLGNVPDERDQV